MTLKDINVGDRFVSLTRAIVLEAAVEQSPLAWAYFDARKADADEKANPNQGRTTLGLVVPTTMLEADFAKVLPVVASKGDAIVFFHPNGKATSGVVQYTGDGYYATIAIEGDEMAHVPKVDIYVVGAVPKHTEVFAVGDDVVYLNPLANEYAAWAKVISLNDDDKLAVIQFIDGSTKIVEVYSIRHNTTTSAYDTSIVGDSFVENGDGFETLKKAKASFDPVDTIKADDAEAFNDAAAAGAPTPKDVESAVDKIVSALIDGRIEQDVDGTIILTGKDADDFMTAIFGDGDVLSTLFGGEDVVVDAPPAPDLAASVSAKKPRDFVEVGSPYLNETLDESIQSAIEVAKAGLNDTSILADQITHNANDVSQLIGVIEGDIETMISSAQSVKLGLAMLRANGVDTGRLAGNARMVADAFEAIQVDLEVLELVVSASGGLKAS